MFKLLFPPTFFPFTYSWIVKRHLEPGSSVLDIGCGDWKFMAHIIKKHSDIKAYGVDLFVPYIDKAKKTKVYKKIFKKDVRSIKFSPKSFDIVLASQVVEHLKKKESLSLIKNMELIASRKVIIGTPNGYFPRGVYESNELQKHNSYWYVEDFNKLGYKVYGQALKFIYGKKGLLNTVVGKFLPLRVLFFLISYTISPIVYFLPRYSAHLIAIKEIKKSY